MNESLDHFYPVMNGNDMSLIYIDTRVLGLNCRKPPDPIISEYFEKDFWMEIQIQMNLLLSE